MISSCIHTFYKELPVAKVEMTEVSVLLYGIIQALIQHLNQWSHVGKIFVHLRTIWKIAIKRNLFIHELFISNIYTKLNEQVLWDLECTYQIILSIIRAKQEWVIDSSSNTTRSGPARSHIPWNTNLIYTYLLACTFFKFNVKLKTIFRVNRRKKLN